MKKLLILILSLILVSALAFSLVSCGGGDNAKDNNGADNTNTDSEGENNNTDNSSGGNNNNNGVEDNGKALYTVYVKDTSGIGVEGVRVQLCTDSGCMAPRVTAADGKVEFELNKDNYKAQISSLPAGYSADLSKKYEFTGNTVTITVELNESYTVLVKDQNGAAVENAAVTFSASSSPVSTDSQGSATFTAPKADNYKAFIIAPDGYIAEAPVATFTLGKNLVTVIVEKLTAIKVEIEAPDGVNTEGSAIIVYENGKDVGYGIVDSEGASYIYVKVMPGKTYTAKLFTEPSADNLTANEAEIINGVGTITLSE